MNAGNPSLPAEDGFPAEEIREEIRGTYLRPLVGWRDRHGRLWGSHEVGPSPTGYRGITEMGLETARGVVAYAPVPLTLLLVQPMTVLSGCFTHQLAEV